MNGEGDRLFDEPFTDGLSSLVAAAHELKSPLALVRQLSLMLEDDDVPTAERKKMMRQITLTSERALRLTSDLTKSVRLTDAMFELEPINPQQLCKDIVNELTPYFRAHNRKIRLIPNRQSLLLVANRDLLKRVIMNFSDNALHYTESGALIEIKVCTHRTGQTVRLGVRDYGPALPNTVFKSIRNKSVCDATNIHSRPQSSGLGLYIASQFADAMNGQIGVTRHHDGVTFYIDLQASRQLSLL